jgi:hypothetical protein
LRIVFALPSESRNASAAVRTVSAFGVGESRNSGWPQIMIKVWEAARVSMR